MKVRCKGCKATIKLKGKRPPAGKTIQFSCPKCGHVMRAQMSIVEPIVQRPSDDQIVRMLSTMDLPHSWRN